MDSNNSRHLNWNSSESHFLFNPRWDVETRTRSKKILQSAPDLPGHIWIQSSGSTSSANDSAKWIALSKSAFLSSAEAVNLHLKSDSQDRWGISLPLFHVGGLSILARAFLSQSKILHWDENWDPILFYNWLNQEKITLLSLVPTQLFDFVEAELKAPKSLRGVILGGAALDESLYLKARELGWPVMPSFGMTEFCSQVATAQVGDPDLILLSHVQAHVDEQGLLWLKGPSCYSGFLQERSGQIYWTLPELEDGFLKTSDRAEIKGRILRPLGRHADFIKIKGEGLNLNDLRTRFSNWIFKKTGLGDSKYAIVSIPDLRDGSRLVLAAEETLDLKGEVDSWNQDCFPIERLHLEKIVKIPRSSLGKVLSGELVEMMSKKIISR